MIAKRSKRTAAKLTVFRSEPLSPPRPSRMVGEATWGETIGDLTADLDRIIARRERIRGRHRRVPPWSIRWEKYSTACAAFGPRTVSEIDSLRSANRTVSPTPHGLAAYAGLAPVNWQSGLTSNTRRARGGNHRVGNAMLIDRVR